MATTTLVVTLGIALAAPSRGDDPKPKDSGRSGRILVLAGEDHAKGEDAGPPSDFLTVDPESGRWAPVGTSDLVAATLSHDGRSLAAFRLAREGKDKLGVWVFDRPGRPVWSEFGGALLFSAPLALDRRQLETYKVNHDGTGLLKLPIPEGQALMDCSADGVWLVFLDFQALAEHRARLTLMRLDGTGRHTVLDAPNSAPIFFARISPDGRRLAYSVSDDKPPPERTTTLWTGGADGRNRKQVPLKIERGARVRPCWSPDGSRLAVGLSKPDEKGGKDRVIVIDPDGKNARTIPLSSPRVALFNWK